MKRKFKNVNWDTVGWIILAIFFAWLFIKVEGWKALSAPTLSDVELQKITETNN